MSNGQTSLKLYWLTIAIILITIFSVAGWKLWQIISPARSATAPLNNECDLHTSTCETVFSDGSTVTLSISPQPIPILKQLQLTSHIEGIEANKVEVDIVGIGMNMGYIRPELSVSEDASYKGETILPVCILEEMPWEARVMIHTDQGLFVAPFRFTTQK